MPNIPITVCVVALTQGDEKNIDPAFQVKLAGFFASAGKPYHKLSPDEWRPFNSDSISEYLKNASIQASFRSLQLDNKATRNQALRDTGLYIIDPLVLVHTVKAATLSTEIQVAIFSGPKAFCIVLPDESLGPLRKDIEACCREKLSDLWTSWKDQDDAEGVLTHEHFEKYLGRLVRLLTEKPNQETLELAKQLFALKGVASPALSQPPPLVKS